MLSSTAFDRRRFLLQSGRLAAGAAGALACSRLPLLQSPSAQPTAFAPYKALVCVFLTGGNDSFNLLVPTSAAEYAVYQQSRQTLAVAKNSLLPIVPDSALAGGATYGLHSALGKFAGHFASGKLALVANVGPLVVPTSKAAYKAASVALPPQLFSHSDQANQWQLANASTSAKVGWGGRVADQLSGINGDSILAMNVSISGANLFQAGSQGTAYTMSSAGSQSLWGFSGPQGKLRAESFEKLLDQGNGHIFERRFGDTQREAVAIDQLISAALEDVPVLKTAFDAQSNLAQQLKMVARMISIRDQIGMSRQIFYVSAGGFDTHDLQNEEQPGLFSKLADALNSFQLAMEELQISNSVTAFTASDFGRTLSSNGKGSDHGWGGHHVVLGAAVRGRDIYGSLPNLALEGPDDAGSGRIIPTSSVDQYAATLARWFGLSAGEIETVFPNLENFASSDLGFML